MQFFNDEPTIDTRTIVSEFKRRCQAAQSAGGVAAQDVLDGRREAPDGWKLEIYSQYYLPPNVRLI